MVACVEAYPKISITCIIIILINEDLNAYSDPTECCSCIIYFIIIHIAVLDLLDQ